MVGVIKALQTQIDWSKYEGISSMQECGDYYYPKLTCERFATAICDFHALTYAIFMCNYFNKIHLLFHISLNYLL